MMKKRVALTLMNNFMNRFNRDGFLQPDLCDTRVFYLINQLKATQTLPWNVLYCCHKKGEVINSVWRGHIALRIGHLEGFVLDAQYAASHLHDLLPTQKVWQEWVLEHIDMKAEEMCFVDFTESQVKEFSSTTIGLNRESPGGEFFDDILFALSQDLSVYNCELEDLLLKGLQHEKSLRGTQGAIPLHE